MCLPMESTSSSSSPTTTKTLPIPMMKRSEAIWISNKKSMDDVNNNNNKNSYDSGFGAFSYGSSVGSNIMSRSPFDYRRQSSYPDNNKNNDYGNRRRTMTVSNDSFDNDSSSNYQSSPFRRSNSISGRVEPNFGGIIKRSIGQLFNAATVNTSLATATIQKSVPKVKCVSSIHPTRRNSNERNEQITDHMVSYLCESAIR